MPRLDIYGNPMPSVDDLLPHLTPDQSQSLSGSVLNAGLSGLSFLGNVLDTPGSIARGLLAGDPGRAFGGILNPDERVRGAELIGGSKDDPLLSGMGLAGMGVDILTDPLTFLSFGGSAVNKLGQAAKKIGVLPATGSARAAGLGAREASALMKTTGMPASEVVGKSLGGHMGIGLPFGDNLATFNLAPLGQGIADFATGVNNIAGKIPVAGPLLHGVESMIGAVADPLKRAGSALFDPAVGGAFDATKQGVNRETYAVAQKARTRSLLEDVAPTARAYGQDALAGTQELRQLAENVIQPGQATPGASRAIGVAQPRQANALAEAQAAGLDIKGYDNFLHRQVLKPELDVAREAGKGNPALKPFATSMIEREQLLRDIPGGTETLNKIVMDQRVGTQARTAADTATAAGILVNDYGISSLKAPQLAEYIWGLHPERQKIGMFSNSPMTDFETGMGSLRAATATAKKMTEIIAREATPQAMAGGRSVKDVISNLGLTSKAEDNLLHAMGQGQLATSQAGKNFLATQHIPRELADALENGVKGFTTPDALKPVLSVIDSATQFLKGRCTSAFPAFHTRNLASGAWQNFIQHGVETPGNYGAAMKAIRGQEIPGISQTPYFKGKGLNDLQATQQFSDLAFAHGMTGQATKNMIGPQAAEDLAMRIPGLMPGREAGLDAGKAFVRDWIPRSGEAANPLNMRGVFGQETSKFAPVAAGQKLGNEIEDMGRIAGFYGMIKKGYIPEEAAALTKAAQVDYSQLTGFEREIARRVIPFYGFMRGNVPWQVKQLMENPGGLVGQTIKGTAKGREEGGFEPPFLAPGTAIPMGKEEGGVRRYLTGLGLPYEQLGELFSPTKMAGNVSPYIKAPIEWLTNRQLYSGRDLRDLHSRLEDLVGTPVSRGAENLVMNSPASRAVTTIGTLADNRKTWLDKLVNLGTGVKLTDVNVDQSRNAALREGMMDELRGQPGVGMYSRMYFKPEEIANMSPRQQALARLYMDQERKNREAARQKAGAR